MPTSEAEEQAPAGLLGSRRGDLTQYQGHRVPGKCGICHKWNRETGEGPEQVKAVGEMDAVLPPS